MRSESQKQEARVADRFGGRTVPGSGNQWWMKNDVRTSNLSFELKTTGKKQYPLKDAELTEAYKNATLEGKEAVFGIQFEGSRRNWILVTEDFFEELLDSWS